MIEEKAKVIEMPAPGAGRPKAVRCEQKAIDALPAGSGDWVVEGVPGLIVRCGARDKVFRLQRRIRGRLVRVTLGAMTAAAARREALKAWAKLKPRAAHGSLTLAEAWSRYLDEKPLAQKTRELYRYNGQRHLADWMPRTLADIGADRAGVRSLYQALLRKHGRATARQVMQMLSAVYRYFRRVDPDLPECPTIAVDVQANASRDWALSDDELRRWWSAVQGLRSPIKRAWWLTALLTGARCESITMLKWTDLDFSKRVIHFRVAKGGRTYSIPMADRLAKILEEYKGEALPSEWVFPSPRKPGEPLYSQVRDDKRGVVSPHHLRHTIRTRLAEVGATPDLARIALGHSMSGDVSRGYITPSLLVEAVRPLMNAVAERYAAILNWDKSGQTS